MRRSPKLQGGPPIHKHLPKENLNFPTNHSMINPHTLNPSPTSSLPHLRLPVPSALRRLFRGSNFDSGPKRAAPPGSALGTPPPKDRRFSSSLPVGRVSGEGVAGKLDWVGW